MRRSAGWFESKGDACRIPTPQPNPIGVNGAFPFLTHEMNRRAQTAINATNTSDRENPKPINRP